MSQQAAASMALIDFAANYAHEGLATIPIPEGAKGPRLREWPELATTDCATHAVWFVDDHTNIGIVTGQKSGVFAVDVDAKSGGLDTLRNLEARHGPLPDTPTQRTGGGGLHYLFRLPTSSKIGNAQNLAPGIDIRGEGCGAARCPNADRRRNPLIGFASVGSILGACSHFDPLCSDGCVMSSRPTPINWLCVVVGTTAYPQGYQLRDRTTSL